MKKNLLNVAHDYAFIKNFDKYTKAGQKNITQLAKEKGFVIETRSKPLNLLADELGEDVFRVDVDGIYGSETIEALEEYVVYLDKLAGGAR